MTAKNSVGADALASILASQKPWSLEAGAKTFSIGRNVANDSISIIEASNYAQH
jgi:hypothetical protein